MTDTINPLVTTGDKFCDDLADGFQQSLKYLETCPQEHAARYKAAILDDMDHVARAILKNHPDYNISAWYERCRAGVNVDISFSSPTYLTAWKLGGADYSMIKPDPEATPVVPGAPAAS